jgi:hypothetical protein
MMPVMTGGRDVQSLSDDDRAWVQPGITAAPTARAFLDTLASRDTLVMPSADGDIGYRFTRSSLRSRGLGATIARGTIAATAPDPDLARYHGGLGLEPERRYCPDRLPPAVPLAELVLSDTRLVDQIREDGLLRRMVVAFKDRAAEALIERLGLSTAYCSPSASAYERANDKLEFSRAAGRYGFDAVELRPVADLDALHASFHELSAVYGEGCVLRLRRGAAGRNLSHARTLSAARRTWKRLSSLDVVLVGPYIPPSVVRRDVSAHGIVTPDGFAALAFSEQLLRGHRYRGSRVTHNWVSEEIAAVSSSLRAIAAWLRDLGYVGAPAGVDGFLVDGADGLRFIALDPNIRMTATMMPWAVASTLGRAAGRRFAWQYESSVVIGRTITFRSLERRLGSDLLRAARLEHGGILPSVVTPAPALGLGISRFQAILLARDADDLRYLSRRTRGLGLLVR